MNLSSRVPSSVLPPTPKFYSNNYGLPSTVFLSEAAFPSEKGREWEGKVAAVKLSPTDNEFKNTCSYIFSYSTSINFYATFFASKRCSNIFKLYSYFSITLPKKNYSYHHHPLICVKITTAFKVTWKRGS